MRRVVRELNWNRLNIGHMKVTVMWRRWDGERHPTYSHLKMVGTLGLLVEEYYYRWDTWPDPPYPAGIFIDRLQEAPEELVGATSEQVDAILLYLRQRHPNGV